MAISTDCPKCGKKYKAADQMVGYRVRCRGCGTVFALTTGGDGGDADLSALAELAGAGDPAAALAEAVGANAAAAETNAVFESGFTDFAPTVRPNRPFYYPLAHVLDRYLPIALFVGAGLWVTIEAFNRNRTGAIWVPFLRLFLLTLGYFAIVMPLGYFALLKASKLAKFELPPQVKYRSAATLALPYGIVCLLWLTVGNFADAVPGVILGLAVVMGAVALLIRIRGEEAAVTLGLVSGAFLASLLILIGVLSGVNLIAKAAVGESKSRLAESPIGPGMAWDAPVPPAKPNTGSPKKEGDGNPVVATNDIPNPEVAGTDNGGTATKPAGGTGSPEPDLAANPAIVPPTTPPGASVANGGVPTAGVPSVASVPPGVTPAATPGARPATPSSADPLAGSKMFGQAPSAPRPTDVAPPPVVDVPPDPDPVIRPNPAFAAASGNPATPGVGGLPGAVGPGSVAVAGDDPVSAEIRATRSPLVASVRSGGTVGSFDRLVPTLTPSPVALVIKKSAGGGDADQLEVWNFDRAARLGSVEVKRDLGKGVGVVDGAPGYAVSPDGANWARVTSFPTLGLESTPLAGNASPVRVPFKEAFGDATLLGYVSADRLLVRWRNVDHVRLELWDLKGKAMAARVLANYFPSSPGNGVVSPDGKLYAAVVGVPNRTGGGFRPQLAVYDLARPPGRTVPILGMETEQAAKPTGMAFSTDMKSLGLLYEQSGNTVLMSYKLGSLAAMTPIPIAAGKVPVPTDKASDRLTSVADGRGWLVGGNAVLEADTGNLLGTLGVSKPCSHVAVGNGIELITGDGGQRSLAMVTFNKAAIGKPTAAPVVPVAPVRPAAGQAAPPAAAPVAIPVTGTVRRPANPTLGLPTAAGR